MSYVKWHRDAPNVVEQVCCPDCGAILVKLVLTDDVVESQVVNGVVKERTFAVHAATPMYDTCLIDMEDGSKFEVPVCRECKQKIKTPEDEERLLRAGIAAMEDEDSRAGGARRLKPEFKKLRPKRLAEKLGKKKPTDRK